MQPKISVIIPVYNVEKYLRECLDSVINQTLKDIEIICIDDGSTDNSGIILDEYASKDSRIKVIHKENQGAGAARNIGLNMAKGDYLAILDSDDVYNTSMLEKMYDKSVEYDLDIAICRSCQLNERTGKVIKIDWTIKKDWLSEKEIFNYKDLSKYIIGFCIGWTWDKLFKRDFIEKYQLRFPEIHNSEDGMFTFGALCVADKISLINDILATHRTNTITQLSERRDESHECFIEGAKILKEFLEKNDRYEVVEQSFINWFVEHSYWHLDTLNIKNAYELENTLREVFDSMDIFNHNARYFYNYEYYIRLKMMIHKIPYDLYKILSLNTALTREKSPKYSFFEKIFSVKNSNDRGHKIVTFLGIKIKIKRNLKNKKDLIIKNDLVNMHIFFACDNNFILPLICTMSSILRNAKDTDYHNFYVLDKDISESNKLKIQQLKKIKDFSVEFIKIDDNLFKDLPQSKDCMHIPKQTYYRYIIPQIKPKLDKALYLDCDILVLKSLQQLCQIDLKNTYCGVVEETYVDTQKDAARLGVNAYFNAGILLLNNKKLREENFTKILFENTYKLYQTNNMKYQDQDVLNYSFKNNVTWLNPCFNYQQNCYPDYYPTKYSQSEMRYANSNIVILHYNTGIKPWKSNNSVFYKYIYLKEMCLNGFYKETLDCLYKKIYQNIFSIKNSDDKKHKVITILGLRIKVRRGK